VEIDQWYAIFAPAKTPKDVIVKLNSALNKVLSDPEIIKRIEGHGADVETSTPEQLAEMVRKDLIKWRQVVQRAKLQAD
jgi:tripartite-type tricarboxylate transporter receptor subunit TctC